jgi:transposase-like protein
MGAKKLSDADKTQAVLDLLPGKGTMAEICNRCGISPTYLYQLRDRALEAGSSPVVPPTKSKGLA